MPGFLLAHVPYLKNIESHTVGAELQIELDQSNTRWGRHYNAPVTGFGVNYINFGRDETGWAVSLQGNIKFKLIEKEQGALSFRLGAGIGYLNRIFDEVNNLRNQAIGSHLNGFMQTALFYERQLANSEIAAGLALSHFSNGAYRMPNLGLNLPSLYLRYSRDVNWFDDLKAPKGIDPWLPDTALMPVWNYAITGIYTHKERTLSNPAQFTLFGVQTRAIYARSIKHSWRVGLDGMFDKTYAYVRDIETDLDTVSYWSQFELGVAVGKSWNFGKLQVVAEVGTYLARPTTYKRTIYERIGLTYHLTEHLGLQSTLKFHRAVADYIEWGLAYRL